VKITFLADFENDGWKEKYRDEIYDQKAGSIAVVRWTTSSTSMRLNL